MVKDIYSNGTILLLDQGEHGSTLVAHKVGSNKWELAGVYGAMSLARINEAFGPFDGKPAVLDGGVDPESILADLDAGSMVTTNGYVWTKKDDGTWETYNRVGLSGPILARKLELVKETEVLWDVR